MELYVLTLIIGTLIGKAISCNLNFVALLNRLNKKYNSEVEVSVSYNKDSGLLVMVPKDGMHIVIEVEESDFLKSTNAVEKQIDIAVNNYKVDTI